MARASDIVPASGRAPMTSGGGMFRAAMLRVEPMRTVVVIEEDGAMHALLREWLVQAGYRVGAAHEPADLVVLDVSQPGAGAAARVRAVRAARPGALLVGLSTQLGRSLPGSSVSARTLGVAALVAKPCTRHELLGAVAAAFGPAA